MSRVFVDLAAEPVATELRKRYDLVSAVADELLHDGLLDGNEVRLDEDRLARSVEAYFLMSEAYKTDRLGHTATSVHLTEPSKKAALTAISFMTFRPFQYLDPSRPIIGELSYRANQTLIMTCAGSLMERDFDKLTFEMQRRLFRLMDGIHARCLDDYVKDQGAGTYKQAYQIDLDPDIALIDTYVLIFEAPLRP